MELWESLPLPLVSKGRVVYLLLQGGALLPLLHQKSWLLTCFVNKGLCYRFSESLLTYALETNLIYSPNKVLAPLKWNNWESWIMSAIWTVFIKAEHGIPVANMVTLMLANPIVQWRRTNQSVVQVITEEGISSPWPAVSLLAAISIHD